MRWISRRRNFPVTNTRGYRAPECGTRFRSGHASFSRGPGHLRKPARVQRGWHPLVHFLFSSTGGSLARVLVRRDFFFLCGSLPASMRESKARPGRLWPIFRSLCALYASHARARARPSRSGLITVTRYVSPGTTSSNYKLTVADLSL